MNARRQETVYISLRTAVRQTGLSPQAVEDCVERRLVREPLSDADLLELRRIRRLRELGVNMAGIEIILRMRRRIQFLQAELARQEQMWGGSTGIEAQGLWQRLLPWDEDLE
jgi:hypothetical protein